MMAPEYYIFTGRDGEVVPDHITHLHIAKSLNYVPARACRCHPNLQVVECHEGVEIIEEEAFDKCPVTRVIMPGVKVVEMRAFNQCPLTYIECGKLERVEAWGFRYCVYLENVDLPSIKVLEGGAFADCRNLSNVNLGKDLESIRGGTFDGCRYLERITLPLKDDMIWHNNAFQWCPSLEHVDLVGGVHETIAALLLDEWKNDINEEIESISQILQNTPSGYFFDVGGNAQAIRTWISSVLRKYIHYKSEHRRRVNEAATALQLVLPNDVLFRNVLPFVELPSETTEGEEGQQLEQGLQSTDSEEPSTSENALQPLAFENSDGQRTELDEPLEEEEEQQQLEQGYERNVDVTGGQLEEEERSEQEQKLDRRRIKMNEAINRDIIRATVGGSGRGPRGRRRKGSKTSKCVLRKKMRQEKI